MGSLWAEREEEESGGEGGGEGGRGRGGGYCRHYGAIYV